MPAVSSDVRRQLIGASRQAAATIEQNQKVDFKAHHDGGEVHATVSGSLNNDIVKVDSISGKR